MSADNSPEAEKHNEALFEGYQQRLDQQQQQQQNPSQRRSRSAATRPSLSKRMEQLASTPTRRRESNNNINETPRRSSTPRPSLSFWAGPPRRTVGGRHTLSVEEDSLVLSQHRASMLSATRYRNAQRSSSASQRMGWSDYRDAEEQRHRRMTGGERLAMDIMANNDYQRQEVYARAQEYELEREAYVVDMQISRAERNKEVVEGVFAARQQHRAEAQRFRIGREEDNRIRRREVEAIRSERVEAIAARTSEVKADPYAMLLVRRTYSNLAREERERSATPSRCSSVIRHSRGWR